MALIKCPECKQNISDRADSCPHCGYELKKTFKINNKFNNKNKFILLGIALVLVIGGIWSYLPNNKKDPVSNETQYETHVNNYLGVSFKYPKGYNITMDDDGFIYISKELKDKTATIPYIIIGRYDKFNSPITFFNSFTVYMQQTYGSSLKSVSDVKTGTIGDKTIYGVGYGYTVDQYNIVDNRYAFILNNKIYMVGTKEVDNNTDAINKIAENIIISFKEGEN